MGREMRGRVAGALMGHHLLQRRLELVVRDVLRDGVGEDVAHERVERGGVAVRQLRQRVDAQRLGHEQREAVGSERWGMRGWVRCGSGGVPCGSGGVVIP